MSKRILLAVLLCSAIFFIHVFFVAPHLQRGEREGPRREIEPPPLAGKEAPLVAAEKPSFQRPAETEAPIRPDIVMETPILSLTFTNRGAALKEVVLKSPAYLAPGGKGELHLLHPFVEDEYSLTLEDREGKYDLAHLPYEVVSQTEKELVFRLALKEGLVIEKEFHLETDSYAIGVKVNFSNQGAEDKKMLLRLRGPAGISSEQPAESGGRDVKAFAAQGKPEFALRFSRADLARISGEKLLAEVTEPFLMVGVENQYFAAVLSSMPNELAQAALAIPLVDENALAAHVAGSPVLFEKEKLKLRKMFTKSVAAAVDFKPIQLASGSSASAEFRFFIGPKKRSILAQFPGHDQLLNYGWLSPLCVLLLWIVNAFYRIIPNYGVGILLLTGLIRVLMHPLARKSQSSMQKMQKMRPKILELQEKHKKNPERLREEQMKLMREHGTSPFGGCLVPMAIQFPVFLAMYRILSVSIEMRQAPFFWWIRDLSQPDVILNLPFAIPFLGTSHLSLLPILMTVVMVIQQVGAPKPDDPQAQAQAKMMYIMPVFFGFILYRFASGLNLYWLLSSLIGIFEQRLIRKSLAQ